MKRKSKKYTQELMVKMVKESLSVTEILKRLGLREAGGNFKTIKYYIEHYSIDTTHFKEQTAKRIEEMHVRKTIPLEKILVSDSDYGSTKLKKRLYLANIKKPICELCKQGELWMGRRMALILDHINGNHRDNRLENLQVICPNCNATLDTFCGRNTSKRNVKLKSMGIDVGTKIDFRVNMITDERKTSYINRRRVVRPDFELLMKEVNQLGYEATGRKYGVSGNAIKKWIKTYRNYKM